MPLGSLLHVDAENLLSHKLFLSLKDRRRVIDLKEAEEKLKIPESSQISTEVKRKTEQVASFVKKNVPATGGVFRGFLLGMAS